MKIISYGAKLVHLVTANSVIENGLGNQYQNVIISCDELIKERLEKIGPLIINNLPNMISSVGKFGRLIEEELDWIVVDKSIELEGDDKTNFAQYCNTISSDSNDEDAIWEFLNLFENPNNLPYLVCALDINESEEQKLLSHAEILIIRIQTDSWIEENIG